MRQNQELLEGNTGKIFLSFLLPSVGGMLGISLYVLGDTLLVGRGLGSNGLTALNVSIPIMNIFAEGATLIYALVANELCRDALNHSLRTDTI
ncbi:MAG TPA: hypothetical protein VK031_01155 [Tissierellaceae bacterium]|nr:hypothetical protein [Tissierellaceae bacterium]